ncbi:MAG: pyrimidine 5'-nucleotidase [Candidatus Accumulibacter sp.]|nr:pyrimidine 5'-nucleotidase [Accumulibacter sp.]
MTHAPVWLFDLDNTLHDASRHIFPHINRAMVDYICRHLEVDEEQAIRLRQQYWLRYGATLLGLMRHHRVDPRHFLWHTHQFPDLRRMVVFERALRVMLRRLPGRKIIFSNAPGHYSRAILELTGIVRHFDALYSVERVAYQPKPAIGGFRLLLHRERLVADRCVLVDDSLANLQTAKRLGMKTVWISRSTRQPAWVDSRLNSVLELTYRRPAGIRH